MTDTSTLPALGADFTIVNAAGLREALLARMAADESESFVLDLSDVTDFDSAGVQLLLALRNQLAAADRQLTLGAASLAVRDALHVFGLQALLPAGN